MIFIRPGAAATDKVVGERSLPSVSAERSLQSRVSSIIACTVMLLFGAAMLTWYYSNALSRPSRLQNTARSAIARTAQGEMPLPSIEAFNLLGSAGAPPVRPVSATPARAGIDPPLAAISLPLIPLEPAPSIKPSTGVTGPVRKQRNRNERLLAGVVFARESGAQATAHNSLANASGETGSSAPEMESAAANGALAGGQQLNAAANEGADAASPDLASLLRPAVISTVRPSVVPTQRFLLPKGAFIDCTLETAIDSTLPGMTTCITATDTFSADGLVVLLERGTKLVGETRGHVQQGVARVFVLWTQARTPAGIVVPLDSPGTDELGRSGLSGQVNRHFWQRFGAAVLVSTLDGVVQAAVQSASRNGGPIIYSPSAPAGVATDVLKNSVNIPPTITKANGDRIQVLVARDVDFRSVYELRTRTTPR